MVFVPGSQRQVGTPGGGVLPSPSGQNVQFAGARDKAVSRLGDAIAEIGFVAQKANDDAELRKATTDIDSQVSSLIATNTRDITDPKVFRSQTSTEVDKAISGFSVGFRNKKNFSVITNQLKANSEKAIFTTFLKKTKDVADADSIINERNLLDKATKNVAALGALGGTDAINQRNDFLGRQFKLGLIDLTGMTQKNLSFQKEVARTTFDVLLTQGNVQDAKKFLKENNILTAKEKIDLRFKVASKLDKLERENDKKFEQANEVLIAKYYEEANKGNLESEGSAIQDGLSMDSLINDRDNGLVDSVDFKQLMKIAQGIEDLGGIGDQGLTNTLINDIPEDEVIDMDLIKKMQDDSNDTLFNTDQMKELRAAVKTRDGDIQRRLTSPLASRMRSSIKTQYGVTPLIGSTRLKKQAKSQFDATMRAYDAFLLQGVDPRVAHKKAFELVGPVPGSTVASEVGIANLKEEFEEIGKRIQKNIIDGVKQDNVLITNDKIRLEALNGQIKDAEKQIQRNKELEVLLNVGT